MNSSRKMIFRIACLCFFWAASDALGQEMHRVNTPFQICSSGDLSCAQDVVRKLAAAIPGLQTEIRKEACLDSAGKDVSYYAVYVWHKNMTAEEIAHTLGEQTCASCRKGEDICPEITGP